MKAINEVADALEGKVLSPKIVLIKLYREWTGAGLKEAKDFVEGQLRCPRPGTVVVKSTSDYLLLQHTGGESWDAVDLDTGERASIIVRPNTRAIPYTQWRGE